ncbi:MAG: cytochrome c3 family protein [Desulfobacteraceae bacterium]|nr:cytochrome c3 family protein [Desulfobacteraceae bacterium]MBC2755294.1 cytochrome c3 family protein [Desulfobacteraceae bacterium]
MKKNKILLYTVVFSFFLLIRIFSAVSQEDIETVDDSAFKKLTRPPVSFFHDEHNENANIDECNVCHHMFEDGEKLEYDDSIGMECSACHYSEPRETEADLIRSYHLQCSGCHLKQKTGPVMCGECHRKK